METRTDYERALRRQLARVLRKLRSRQEGIFRRMSDAQKRWGVADAYTPEGDAAMAALTPKEAFVCGATFLYEVVIEEMRGASRVARLAARIPDGA